MSATSAQMEQKLDASSPIWRPSYLLIATLLLVFAATLYPFWQELQFMWGWWMDRPEFSHGVLMPLLAIFLFWQQSDKFERVPFANNFWGVAVTLLGALLYLMGKMGSVVVLVQYAYVVTLGGLALSLVSRRAAMTLIIPFVILVLAVPVPEFVLKNMTAELQLISSKLAVAMMRGAGVSVFLEGNIIDLGTAKLEVAEACSGLRYLFPLMTLGFIMACFYKASMWKRVLVFASSVPITIFMNSFRIAFVGITVDRWGNGLAEGFLHDFEGWIIFIASTLVMIAEIALLNRMDKRRLPWRDVFGIEMPRATPQTAPRLTWRLTTTFALSAAIVVGLCGFKYMAPETIEQPPPRDSFAEFPLNIDRWSGSRVAMEPEYLNGLKLDDYIIANFIDSGSMPINLYVAWYNSQRGGQSSHSPRTCLPGGGWHITSLERTPLTLSTAVDNKVFVNRALIENGGQRQLVYYWFQQRGRIVTNEYLVKWWLFWDSAFKHRTDGALVRLIISVPEGESIADADKKIAMFAGSLLPRLTNYVPN